MKNIRYLFASLIVIFICGCQKGVTDEITTTPNKPALSKVKTYTEDYTSASSGHVVTTFNVTYDANDRTTSLISATAPGDKFVYQYNSNNTFTMDLYNSNVLSIHVLYYLNSYSLIDSTFSYNNTYDTSTNKYLYNSAKQLTKIKEYDYRVSTGSVLYNTTDYVYDSNGNATSEKDNFTVTNYDYYTNLLNDVSIGLIHFSKNKNLTKTTTITSGGTTETLNHTYTFDSSNRLSTEKVISSNSAILIKTYTY